MRNDASVVTDLGALLRDSLRESAPDEQELHGSGSMPVQLGTPPRTISGVQPVVRNDNLADLVEPGAGTARMASLAPLPPVAESGKPAGPRRERGVRRRAEGADRAFGVGLGAKPQTRGAPKQSSLGLVFGILGVLAIVVGGGAATWYVKHHRVPAPVAAAPAPVTPAVATLPVVTAPAEPAAPAAPIAEATPTVEDTPAAAPAKKHHHRTTPSKVDAPVAVAPKAAETPEKPAATPPPKPAAPGGAVDAVLQQQLSGAIP
jgi:hypothetical protein